MNCNVCLQAKKVFVSSASEISSALNSVQPGDTIVMKNGIWNDQKIVFQKNGTADNKIYLVAETAGKVILSGTSTLRIAGNYLVVDGLYFKDGYSASGAVIEFRNGSVLSNYSRLTNTSIVDYNPADSTKDYKWISLYGTHNRVDHCYLKGKKHLGTTLVVWLDSKPNYHLIDSNYFAYRPVYPENGAETIRIGTSDWSMYNSFTTVEYNYFEECNGETEIVSNKSCGNVYRYNTFKDCQGILTLRHGNNCTVEGNFFFCGSKPNSGGVRIIGEDHKVFNNYIENSSGTSMRCAISIMNGVPDSDEDRYFQVKRAIVVNNTVVNAKESINLGAGKSAELSLPPLDCTISDNIIYSTKSPLVKFTDTPINTTWQGNIFYGTSIGMTLPENNFSTDPKLEKSADNLYRIASSSPAINKSLSNFDFMDKDMDGQARIDVADVGADELSDESVKIKPVGPENTGPEYIRNITAIKTGKGNTVPDKFELMQNYPNPFNPDTKIVYSIPVPGNVSLSIYNVLGKELVQLFSERMEPGIYSEDFSASNFGLSSGVYFYRISLDNFSQTKKMIVLK